MDIKSLHSIFLQTNGVCTDTRRAEKNTLFFALKGDNFNGNEYAHQALDKGCSYAVIDEKEFAEDERFIVVDDVLKTLQDLANYHRMQFKIPIIGITGSNGKTTTKELIGAILETTYKILITQGNLNNHIGVPLTLLQLSKEHELAIIEMGANKPGDIKELVEIADPDYGIITNIGTAHIEGFGSAEGVLQTKKELYDYIEKKEGKIFLNKNDEVLKDIVPKSLLHITYGEEEGNYVNGQLQNLTPHIHFSWNADRYFSPILKTHLVGKYNFTNFLAAIAVGYYFEVDSHQINFAIESYEPTNNRSQVAKTENNTVIVDCYNANPSSMHVALESFMEIENGKRVAILGAMLELGHIAKEEHQKTVDYLVRHNVPAFLVGKEFMETENQLPCFETVEALAEYLKKEPIEDYLVLLKGSRGTKLEYLLENKLL